MKHLSLLWLFCFCVFSVTAKAQQMDDIRDNYIKAVTDKNLCKTMITELSKKTDSPVHLAYLGAFKVIWAKHIFNPLAKFNTFKQGKKQIEAAVKKEENNIEIRFIRLSIQKNCPSFLGYNNHIELDRQFIDHHKNHITSARLKKMIAAV